MERGRSTSHQTTDAGRVTSRQLKAVQRGELQELADLAAIDADTRARAHAQLLARSAQQGFQGVDPRRDEPRFDATYRRLRDTRALGELPLGKVGEAAGDAEGSRNSH